MSGIGPKLPLSRDVEEGFYVSNKTYAEQIKQNFKNLLLTSPGERAMNPDFGVGLRDILFEPRPVAINKIKQRVNQQTKKYLPFLVIEELNFDQGGDDQFHVDSNILSIEIRFSVPSLNLNSSIILNSEDNYST